MNYPVWDLTFIGGGSLIALISIVHVYIAHLAVGGGLFLWLADLKAHRDNSIPLNDYLRRYNWFFLLVSMVFGGVTGVGIWFIIGLVCPAATSALIHTFVFVWAAEWVCFLGEIVALLVYHYYFDALDRKHRLIVAFMYFVFAWLSLFFINGILSFMLSSGSWTETGGVLRAFFNPTFAPSLFFRSCAAFMLAGLFGYVTTVFSEENDFRGHMMRYCTKWLLYPMIGLILSGAWYYAAVPADARYTSFFVNPEMAVYVRILVASTVLIFTGGLAISLRSEARIQKAITAALVAIGLFWMGGFEYVREISRKPWVIDRYMYSTSILKSDEARLNAEGALRNAKWSAVRNVNGGNAFDAGREIFRLQCQGCHTIGGIKNDILPRTAHFTRLGLLAQLTGQGMAKRYMPPFIGDAAEKDALITYILQGLHQRRPNAQSASSVITPLKNEPVPAFNANVDSYVLLCWNDLGMRLVTDCDRWFSISPPANTLEAMLVKRGVSPEIVTDGVTLTYRIESGHENPSRHSRFWDFCQSLFGAKPAANTGLTGNGLSGNFIYNEKSSSFVAESIPVLPYGDSGAYNPYPVCTIEARDTTTGKLLMATKAVAPVSTEMGCRNCHGGGWRWNNYSGISDDTATSILEMHDRSNGTSLLARAKRGRPALCQNCHADPSLTAKGDGKRLNLSAAIHGLHAPYMPRRGAENCVLCHPAGAKGATRFARGVHRQAGIDCVHCHGAMDGHAASLLNAEKGKHAAAGLLAGIRRSGSLATTDVAPRVPWQQEPDCLTCHVNFEKPAESPSAFNRWTSDASELYRTRTDNIGIRCEACHNSPHAEYPAVNPYSARRDSLQPLQYGKAPYPIAANRGCAVCHRENKTESMHHDNMLRMMRRTVKF